jgi:hypothetical protein
MKLETLAEAIIWGAWKAGKNTAEMVAIIAHSGSRLRAKIEPMEEYQIAAVLSRLLEQEYQLRLWQEAA